MSQYAWFRYAMTAIVTSRRAVWSTNTNATEEKSMTIATTSPTATTTTEPTITEHEAAQVERANRAKATPVVFVHGLWLLPSSWDRWVTLFEEAGYVALTPGWPDDPETVTEARQHPEVFAGKGISDIANYEQAIIRRLKRRPVIVGHSFGGLLTMILAGVGSPPHRWLSALLRSVEKSFQVSPARR